jgi:hypothetical protein
MAMALDLQSTPLSRFGAYLVLSNLSAGSPAPADIGASPAAVQVGHAEDSRQWQARAGRRPIRSSCGCILFSITSRELLLGGNP